MRQKYHILIEDKNGQWQELELGSDRIAWSCQVNNIAELVSRQASFSQNIKLPRTARNVNIFDFANCFDAITNNPYKRHNCRIFCADRTIAGKGSFLIILRITEYFECQVLSGNANFFEALQEAPMSDLDLGVFQICNNQMNPTTWHSAYKVAYGSDVVIPSYPFQSEINSVGMTYLRGVGAKYPVMSVDYILQEILSRHGYTLESNIDIWKKMYLSINSAEVEPIPEDLEVFNGQIHTHGWQPIPNELPSVQFQWDVDNDADGHIIEHSPNSIITYFIPAGQKVRFTITNYLAGTVGSPLYAWAVIMCGDVEVYTPQIIFDGTVRDYAREYPNDSNMMVPLTIKAYSPTEPISGMGMTIKIEVLEGAETSNAGGKLVLSERTGFEKQFDFIKFFVQAFGLTVIVDEVNKIVHAYTLDLLYDNIKSGNVVDWSRKVERDPGSLFSFTLNDYARENIISLEENSKDEFTDSVKLYVDNQTLKYSKELFKIGIGSGKDLMVDNLEGTEEVAASIPLVELKPPPGREDNNPYETGLESYLFNATFPTTKPHLVELTDRTVPVRVSNINSKFKYDYQIANHVTAQRIFDAGYAILQDKMLKHARLIEDKFYLTPEDVEKFNPSIPVYIEKYGAYFYVNKIKNFELGKLTTCELIKL